MQGHFKSAREGPRGLGQVYCVKTLKPMAFGAIVEAAEPTPYTDSLNALRCEGSLTTSSRPRRSLP